MSESTSQLEWMTQPGEGSNVSSPKPHRPEGDAPPQGVVMIDASRPASVLDLRNIWAYRELLYFMAWRDIRVRYKQTVLGVAWVVMLPLMSALIFTVFLGRVARVSSEGIPYPLFAYAALLPWTFFSTAVGNGASSLVASSHLITKVYFPRVIIPAAAVMARIVDFAVASVVLVVMMAYYRVTPTASVLMLPLLVLLLVAFTVAFSMWISALNVRYRDVGMIIPVLLQLWMFASPVVYSQTMVPERWRVAYALNPLVGIIGNFRAVLYGGVIDWTALGISVAITAALLAYAVREFGRMERTFADFI